MNDGYNKERTRYTVKMSLGNFKLGRHDAGLMQPNKCIFFNPNYYDIPVIIIIMIIIIIIIIIMFATAYPHSHGFNNKINITDNNNTNNNINDTLQI